MLRVLSLALLLLTALACYTFYSPPESKLIRFEYKKGELTDLCNASLDRAKLAVEAIKSRHAFQLLFFQRSLLAFETALAELADETSPLIFMASVSEDAALREESAACEEKVGQLYPTFLGDKDLYRALKRAIPLTRSERRLATETFRSFEKNGMNLDDSSSNLLKELKQKLASLQTKYSLNLNNDQSSVSFTRDELKGVSDVFLGRLTRTTDQRFVVTTKSTDYLQLMENAHKSGTRKRMMLAYFNRGKKENTKLLEEAIQIRSKIAALLGYRSWGDLGIDGRMAKNSEAVLTFLNGLREKLTLRKNQDLEKLLAFKKTIDPGSKEIEAQDIAYLSNQLKKSAYTFDEEKVAEYFPADTVMTGLFRVYSTLFGVSYVEVKDAPVWAQGVKLYEIRETSNDRLIAYFYKDTIPREGKYGHAAAFPLISARVVRGRYSRPIASIVANFTPPSEGRPSLLTHREVETLFHEFGHIMHQTLTTAPYSSLSGSSVAQDFVEAPSQMLQNWVWNKEILRLISGHFKTGEKLPDELLEKMLAAKDFNQGYTYMRQLLFGLFDMKIHSTSGPVNATQVYNDMHRELFGYSVLEGTHFPASFGHLMGGYDAGYYGYLWSEVYSEDMFSRFHREGLLNATTGADYRRAILASGNMHDAIDLVRRFLGREPNSEAFYKKLGI